jgi:hypothetical protein
MAGYHNVREEKRECICQYANSCMYIHKDVCIYMSMYVYAYMHKGEPTGWTMVLVLVLGDT